MACSNSWKCPAGSFPYTIKQGDTLYSVAKRYQSTSARLIEVNKGINPDNLTIGETICIPLPVQIYPSCRTTNYYVAQDNDTFFSIARYFGITVDQLINSNIGVEPENIYEGMILCIPLAPPPVCITFDNGMMTLDFISGATERFNYSGEALQEDTFISAKQIINPFDGGKRLVLANGVTFICSGERCRADNIELSPADMDKVFNYVTVGTEVHIK